jgi:hypothetical protein
MALRLLILLALGTVCGATALAATNPATTTKDPAITTKDNGKTFTARMGGTLTLRLPGQARWLNPRVTGSAIRLTQVNFLRDPGYRQWSVAALQPGTARISVVRYAESGTRRCDPGPCAPRLFRVTVLVR